MDSCSWGACLRQVWGRAVQLGVDGGIVLSYLGIGSWQLVLGAPAQKKVGLYVENLEHQ